MSHIIKDIHAREILDSRGNPTVAVILTLEDGTRASASVPSGASTGIHEALELRDGDKKRYGGQGVRKAVAHVNNEIRGALLGKDIHDLRALDDVMRALDGTPNKAKLGANAILGVSLAAAQTAAAYEKKPLYVHLREAFSLPGGDSYKMPMPMVNILNGGRHADTDLDFQEFMIVPVGKKTITERVRAASEVFHALGVVLKNAKLSTGVGNEGGYAPMVGKTVRAFTFLLKAIANAGYSAGKDISFAIDAAASEFYNEKTQRYELKTDKKHLTSEGMQKLFAAWVDKFPLISIEDGLAEDDWSGWATLTAALGKKTMLVGDDLFVTNVARLERGIKERVANAILIKVNQIGSLSETIDTIRLAQTNGYRVIISHRSGETADTTIADLAVAVGAEYIKTGSVSRSERVEKYNRLMEIEEELMMG